MSNKQFTVSARETMKFNGFIFQIIIDVSLFHTEFSNLQYLFFGLVAVV